MTRVLHTAERLNVQSGGTAACVTGLCNSLLENDNNSVEIVAKFIDYQFLNFAINTKFKDKFNSFYTKNIFQNVFGISLRSSILAHLNSYRPEIIHDHGIWSFDHHHILKISKKRNIPIIIQTHGMLEPWAICHKGIKKNVAWNLYIRNDLKIANCFIATSKNEAQNIRRLGLRQPIAVIGNGISKPNISKRSNSKKDRRNALFLGRIHPVKGLLNLVKCWEIIRPEGWRLILAGPDCDGHLKQILRFIEKNNLSPYVQYIGEVVGDRKERLYQESDLFILPSYSENFGIVIAEAMSNGLPVITTTGTPWKIIIDKDCGWWVDPDFFSLVGTIKEATQMNFECLLKKGENGKKLSKQFEWSIIADKFLKLYSWVLGNKECPEFVV